MAPRKADNGKTSRRRRLSEVGGQAAKRRKAMTKKAKKKCDRRRRNSSQENDFNSDKTTKLKSKTKNQNQFFLPPYLNSELRKQCTSLAKSYKPHVNFLFYSF